MINILIRSQVKSSFTEDLFFFFFIKHFFVFFLRAVLYIWAHKCDGGDEDSSFS